MPGGPPYDPSYALVWNHQTIPYIIAYNISADDGFISAYSAPGSNPGSPTGTCEFTVTGNAAVWAHQSSVGGETQVGAIAFSVSGWGSTYSLPSTKAQGGVARCAVSWNNDYVAFTNSSSPYITVYEWSDSTGYGSKISDPATLPLANSSYVAFTHADDAIGITQQGSFANPVGDIWAFDNGFGSRFTRPATWDANPDRGAGIDFVLGDYAFMIGFNDGGLSSQWNWAYNWDSSTGYGSAYSAPTPGGETPSNHGWGNDYAGNGDSVAFAGSDGGDKSVFAYAWSDSVAGWGSRYSLPVGSSVAGNVWSLEYSIPDDLIAVAANATDQGGGVVMASMRMWPFDSTTGFGTRHATPGGDVTAPPSTIFNTGTVFQCSFNGRYN